jgi:hypothetical protein
MDGRDGTDGVSVTEAHIDFDGSLIIGLSTGRSINVGEVVAPDLAEKIKVITNGGGTSQLVLDALANLQTQINDIDGFLDYKGTWNASTNTPTLVSSTGTKGDYYVVSVAGSTTLNGESSWGVGDWVVFNNSTWQKVDGGSTGNLTTAIISTSLTLNYGTASTALALDGSKNVVSLANTGTGNNVLATSPTLVTPALGTPSALVGTNITGTAAALSIGGTAANVTGIVAVVNGGTGTTTPSLVAGSNVSISGSWPNQTVNSTAGGGDVVGPASATDNALARFDTTTGELIQNSVAILGDSGNLSGLAAVTATSFAGALNGTVGATTANTGAFTTLSASSTVSGTGFSTYLASPPAIGTTAAAAGAFTTLSATGVTTVQAGSAAAPAITTSGDTNTGIFFPAADTIAFSEGGVETARFDASGNLGLGVTPSAWGSNARALEIGTGPSTSLAFNFSETNLSTNVYRINTGASLYKANGIAMMYSQSTGGHAWSVSPSGTAGNAISFTQAMTLDASGRLGVGTTNPLARLVVSNGSGENLEFTPGSTIVNGCVLQYINRTSESTRPDMNYYLSAGGGSHKFYTNDTERARIDSSGNLLVGTTTTDIWTGSATNTGFRVEPNGTITAARSGFAAVLVKRTTSDGNAVEFARGAAQVGSISVTGSATAYNTSSDYRLKNTIAPMTGALAKVALLKPCTYKWNADGSDGEGFIAHELQAVVPQCVTGEKDAVDAEGKPQYQGIDTSFLVATLTAAIQELKAEFDVYKATHP